MRSYISNLGKALLFYAGLGLSTLGCGSTESHQPNYGTQFSVVKTNDGASTSFRKDNISLTAHQNDEGNLEGKIEVTENHNDFSYKTFSLNGSSSENETEDQLATNQNYGFKASLRLDDTTINTNVGTAVLLGVNGDKGYLESTTEGEYSSLKIDSETTGMGASLDFITDNNWRAGVSYNHESNDTKEVTLINNWTSEEELFSTDVNTLGVSVGFNVKNAKDDMLATWGLDLKHNWSDSVRTTTEGNLSGTYFFSNVALSGSVDRADSGNSGMVMFSRGKCGSKILDLTERVNDIRDFLGSKGNLNDQVNLGNSTYFEGKQLEVNEKATLWHLFYRVDEDSRELGFLGERVGVGLEVDSLKWALIYGIGLVDNVKEDDEIKGFIGVGIQK